MPRTIYQIDAFTDRPFTGNPAAVCLLPAFPAPEWMRRLAREMNLSETAFVVRRGAGFDLRWFTPVAEVDLCGHATLAAAHLLWECHALPAGEAAVFHTRSGACLPAGSTGGSSWTFPPSLKRRRRCPKRSCRRWARGPSSGAATGWIISCCCLGPFWQRRLGKEEMVGYQASACGGTVYVRSTGDRVLLGGHAVTVMRGELMV